MADKNSFGGIEDFFHFYRTAQVFLMKDRDSIAIWTDYMLAKDDPANPYFKSKVTYSDSSGSALYTGEKEITFDGKSVMIYARASNGADISTGVLNGIHVLPYVTEGQVPHPIYGAFSPTITFDRPSNTLTMWFWANMKDGFSTSGQLYDEEQVYEPMIKTTVDGKYRWDWEIDEEKEKGVNRILFCAIGTLMQLSVDGWTVPYGGGPTANNGYDFVPIFKQPVSIHAFDKFDTFPPYLSYPRVYKATEDAADGKIKVKAIKKDGTLVDPEITLNIITET
jgi:hypothetical protein